MSIIFVYLPRVSIGVYLVTEVCIWSINRTKSSWYFLVSPVTCIFLASTSFLSRHFRHFEWIIILLLKNHTSVIIYILRIIYPKYSTDWPFTHTAPIGRHWHIILFPEIYWLCKISTVNYLCKNILPYFWGVRIRYYPQVTGHLWVEEILDIYKAFISP